MTVLAALADMKMVAVNSDKLLIIDCLLPGKVKQLGLHRTYLGRKRPVKTSALDCAMRGGEYTRYDRTDLKSSLRVWLQTAESGDPQAQYYVGEFYEQGLSGQADYQQAALWYQRAALQKYAPAQLGLGRFYEQGLFVEKDLVKAINLYRQASGLNSDEIAYASVFQELRDQDQREIKQLAKQLKQQNRQLNALSTSFSALKSQLGAAKLNAQQLKQQVQQLQEQVRLSSSNDNGVTTQLYDVALRDLRLAQFELEVKTKQVHSLKQKLSQFSNDQTAATDWSEHVQLAKQSLDAKTVVINQQIVGLSQTQQELVDLQRRIAQAFDDKLLLDQAYQRVTTLLSEEKQQLDAQLLLSQSHINTKRQTLLQLDAKRQQAKLDNNALFIQLSAEQELQTQLLISQEQALTLNQQQIELAGIKLDALRRIVKSYDSVDKKHYPQATRIGFALKEREQHLQNQIDLLSKQLVLEKQYVLTLVASLDSTQQHRVDAEQTLVTVEKQVRVLSTQVAEQKQLISRKNSRLALAYDTIKRLSRDLYQRPSQETLKELETTIEQKQNLLEQTQQNNAVLQVKLDETLAQLTRGQHQLTAQVAKTKPIITVKLPHLEQREQGHAVAAVMAGSIVNVVGAVQGVNAISELTINGDLEELDVHGLFLKPVTMTDQPLRLVIKAKDIAGHVIESTVELIPSLQPKNRQQTPMKTQHARIDFGRYKALVIGNNNYALSNGFEPLDTAVNGAQEVAALLEEQYGFQVRLELNVTRHKLLSALEEMRRTLTEEDNLLIYYAGHGLIDPENDQGYWIPIDSTLNSTVNWVSNATITDQVRAMSARNIMIIADSCYSASLMRSGIVMLRSGLSPEKKRQRLIDDIQKVTRVVLSSGGLQPVADSIGNSEHSVFTGAMLETLRQNDELLDADSLATTVGHKVSVSTSNTVKQVPRYAPLSHGGHQGGEFYFAPKDILQHIE